MNTGAPQVFRLTITTIVTRHSLHLIMSKENTALEQSWQHRRVVNCQLLQRLREADVLLKDVVIASASKKLLFQAKITPRNTLPSNTLK